MNKLIGLAAAALGLSLSLSGCGSSEQAEEAGAVLPAGERIVVKAAEIADMKAVGAEIRTRDQAEALARIPGILTSLSVREGDRVKRGQQIGMIVDTRLGFDIGAYAAAAAAAEAEAARARADLARVRDLYDNRVYAKARLDQAVAASRAADAQVAAARAQQGSVSSVARQGAVLAPATGRVLRADVPEGSVVTPGMALVTITAGPPVLRLELPESLAGSIRTGAAVVVAPGDLPEGMRQGRVTEVYPAIRDGRVIADASLPGLGDELVGKRVGASIEVGRRSAVVVPRRFVSTRFGIDQVDIVGKDKRVSAIPVQIASTADAGTVEILSGVRDGDVLIAVRAQ